MCALNSHSGLVFGFYTSLSKESCLAPKFSFAVYRISDLAHNLAFPRQTAVQLLICLALELNSRRVEILHNQKGQNKGLNTGCLDFMLHCETLIIGNKNTLFMHVYIFACALTSSSKHVSSCTCFTCDRFLGHVTTYHDMNAYCNHLSCGCRVSMCGSALQTHTFTHNILF